jgi:hypothetical protein
MPAESGSRIGEVIALQSRPGTAAEQHAVRLRLSNHLLPACRLSVSRSPTPLSSACPIQSAATNHTGIALFSASG